MKNIMKNIVYYRSIILFASFLTGCAISHTYGPFYGKIVDTKTGEPMSGAVVYMEFRTCAPSVAGDICQDAGAKEVLSDENGEFYLKHTIHTFRFLHFWDSTPIIFVWKRGYREYPILWKMHPELPKPSIDPPRYVTNSAGHGEMKYFSAIPENKYAIICLPKLESQEMRKRAYQVMNRPLIHDIPTADTINLRKMIADERKFLGYHD